MSSIRTPLTVSPHEYFGDVTGRPLDYGTIYFGEPDKDPEFYPINVYADEALTQPIPQPIRTKGGFINVNGDIIEIYGRPAIYSVKVLDQYGRKIFYKGKAMRNNANDDIIAEIDAAIKQSKEDGVEYAKKAVRQAIDETVIDGSPIADTMVAVDGSLSQRTINKGLESVADLSTIKNPNDGLRVYVKSYHAGLNKGGGYFTYDSSKADINDGGLVINGWVRDINSVHYNLTWWGVRSDGVTDDQPAIMRAVKTFGDFAYNNEGDLTEYAHTTLHLPASDKPTVIKDTIYLLPYMRIKGESTRGNHMSDRGHMMMSSIETRFTDNVNYKWAISTLNYDRRTGEQTDALSVFSGEQYANSPWIVTGAFGVSVEDLYIYNADQTKRVYGGIKFQCAPESSVVNCRVVGFDVGVHASGAWNSRFDVNVSAFKCGFSGYGGINNVRLNGYYSCDKSQEPLPNQLSQIYASHPSHALENESEWVNYRYGVSLVYANGFASDSLICEHHDVGIYFNHSTGSLQSVYTENNTRGIATVTSNVTINAVDGERNEYSFAFGSTSKVQVNNINLANFKTSFADKSNSSYNSSIVIPAYVNYNGRNVTYYDNDNSIIYISSDGDDNNSGVISNYPVKTFKGAVERFRKQRRYLVSDFGYINCVKVIRYLDTSEHAMTTESLTGDWLIEGVIEGSSKTALRAGGYAYIIATNASVAMRNIKFIKSGDNWQGQYNNGAIQLRNGTNNVNLHNVDAAIEGSYALVSLHNIDSASSVSSVKMSGGSFTATNAYSNIIEYQPSNSRHILDYKIVTSLDSITNGRADKGVVKPVDTNLANGVVVSL